MAIQLTELGPNSCVINTNNEPNSGVNLMALITTWLSQHGWELFDPVSNVNRVFRAQNADGVTYKYVRIDVSTSNSTIYLYHYESWNATTHAGTNLNPISINATSTHQSFSLYLFASARHIALMPKYNGTFGHCLMVLEHSRDNQVPSVLAYPPVVATYGDGAVMRNSNNYGFARSSSGVAGVGNDYAYFSPIHCTVAGSDYPIDSFTSAASVKGFSTIDLWARFTNAVSEHRGRIYGLKIGSANFGSHLDTVTIKCDANGFTDQNGQDVEHFILTPISYPSARFALPA